MVMSLGGKIKRRWIESVGGEGGRGGLSEQVASEHRAGVSSAHIWGRIF